MAINDYRDYVVQYDQDHLLTAPRMLGPNPGEGREWAVQCLAAEILRDILATGITLTEWNGTWAEGAWEAWIAQRSANGLVRAALNVAAAQVPLLNANDKLLAEGLAGGLFESGYPAVLTGLTQENKVTFSRTGGAN